jgi:hypothetical protein
LQRKSQEVPLQVAVALAGAGQGEQELPQALTSLLGRQLSLQACWPAGQTPSQAWLRAMHRPRHNFVPPGQRPPHIPFSQVASPPMGTAQGEQDVPQVLLSVSLTQASPQR